MNPYSNTRSISITYKESLYIVPNASSASPSLPKSDFDHLHSKIQTIKYNIHNDLIDMKNKHKSEMKTMYENISHMLQNLIAEISNTENNEENSQRYHPKSHIMKTV